MPSPTHLLLVTSGILGLAATLPAQIAADSVLVLEQSFQVTQPSFVLVDAFGRGAVTVRDQSVFLAMVSVAIDPTDAARMYFEAAGPSLSGTWETSVTGVVHYGTARWGHLGRSGANRVEAGATQVFTLTGSQLFAAPKAGGTNVAILPVANAVDLAVAEPFVYVVAYDPVTPQPVLELDLRNQTTRTVTSLAGIRAVALSRLSPELVVGGDGGTLLRVDLQTGQVRATLPTPLPSITSVVVGRQDRAVATDGTQIWSELVPGAPIYTGAAQIRDLAIVRTPGAALLPYGSACGPTGSNTWAASGQPALGNQAFALGLRQAAPNSAALLLLGDSRTFSRLLGRTFPIPLGQFGLGSCDLWADPRVLLAAGVNGAGNADQPLPMPGDPSLRGIELGLQWLVFSGPGSNATTSEGLVLQPH